MKIQKISRFWLVLCLMSTWTLTSCTTLPPIPAPTSAQFSCQKFDQDLWKEFRFGVDSPDEVRTTAATLWRIAPEQIGLDPKADDFVRVSWEVNGDQYSALFREDRRLVKVDVYWDRVRPTLAQITECLGFPEQYQAVYQQKQLPELSIDLWYVEKGIVVGGYSYHRQDQPPEIGSNYPTRGFTVVAPADVAQMVPNVYTAGDRPGIQAYALRLLKPWPGAIKAIQVDSCIDNPDLCRTSIR